jgi:quercetin dioxygenase-like cupin family protein
MNTEISNYLVRSNAVEWKPLLEPGVDTKGIFVKVLRYDEETHRAPTILLKFEPGASYPYHNHPAGEEIFVLEGSAVIEGASVCGGDYLYTPPGFRHSVTTKNGCVLLLVIPEEVEIL